MGLGAMEDSQSTPGIGACNVHKATASANWLYDRFVPCYTKQEMLVLEPVNCRRKISSESSFQTAYQTLYKYWKKETAILNSTP